MFEVRNGDWCGRLPRSGLVQPEFHETTFKFFDHINLRNSLDTRYQTALLTLGTLHYDVTEFSNRYQTLADPITLQFMLEPVSYLQIPEPMVMNQMLAKKPF